MNNLYLTTLLIERVPSWRSVVSTACQIKGREFSEELLYQVTFELSGYISQDPETLEVEIVVEDQDLFDEVEKYEPEPVEEPQVEALLERVTALEKAQSTLDSRVFSLQQVVVKEPSEAETIEPLPEMPSFGRL